MLPYANPATCKLSVDTNPASNVQDVPSVLCPTVPSLPATATNLPLPYVIACHSAEALSPTASLGMLLDVHVIPSADWTTVVEFDAIATKRPSPNSKSIHSSENGNVTDVQLIPSKL